MKDKNIYNIDDNMLMVTKRIGLNSEFTFSN